MTDIVKCDYMHSSEYRGFVQEMAFAGLSLSNGVWWVKREASKSGSIYHLYCTSTYFGAVSKEDVGSVGLDTALWKLMKYLEGFMRYSDWAVIVFPKNWSDTNWSIRSFEFVYMVGVRSVKDWETFCRTKL